MKVHHRSTGGRYVREIQDIHASLAVSILARTEVRALPRIRTSRSGNMRFNPRPHRGAGATLVKARIVHKLRVSILARTEVRALRDVRLRLAAVGQPVSILARTEVRALLEATLMRNEEGQVSILARTEVRALPGLIAPKPNGGTVSILARTEVRALLSAG